MTIGFPSNAAAARIMFRPEEHSSWRYSELATSARHLAGGHVVVGNFDGVHLGHQALLRQAARRAAAESGPVVALMFERHADDSDAALTDVEETVRLLHAEGAEVVRLGFTREASWLHPQSFQELLQELAPKSVTIAAGFHLGPDGVSKASQLIEHGNACTTVPLSIMPSVTCGEYGVASAANIRAHLSAGRIKAVNALLGRPWSMEGRVVHGFKRGRELGFPTANVQSDRQIGLAYAIYAVRVHHNGRVMNGVASYGTRPQFDNGRPLLEVHVIDFSGDLYGSVLRVEFVAHQRPELVFSCVDELTRQMEMDRASARDLLLSA